MSVTLLPLRPICLSRTQELTAFTLAKLELLDVSEPATDAGPFLRRCGGIVRFVAMELATDGARVETMPTPPPDELSAVVDTAERVEISVAIDKVGL